MEPIIKVISTVKDSFDPRFEEETQHYFQDVTSAKRWCEFDIQQPIDWQMVHVNGHHWRSGEIFLKDNGLVLSYNLEPVKITVVDDDGFPQ